MVVVAWCPGRGEDPGMCAAEDLRLRPCRVSVPYWRSRGVCGGPAEGVGVEVGA